VPVVDNGSTDDTGDVVSRLSAELPQIRLAGGPARPNQSAARNLGAAFDAGPAARVL